MQNQNHSHHNGRNQHDAKGDGHHSPGSDNNQKSHAGHETSGGHDHTAPHRMMIIDFRKRFWVSLADTMQEKKKGPMTPSMNCRMR